MTPFLRRLRAAWEVLRGRSVPEGYDTKRWRAGMDRWERELAAIEAARVAAHAVTKPKSRPKRKATK